METGQVRGQGVVARNVCLAFSTNHNEGETDQRGEGEDHGNAHPDTERVRDRYELSDVTKRRTRRILTMTQESDSHKYTHTFTKTTHPTFIMTL